METAKLVGSCGSLVNSQHSSLMVEHGAGEHPDRRAWNTPAFLTSDTASVAPVNSVR